MLVEIRFGSRGCPSRGILMWQWEVPWPDHSLEIQFPIRNLYGISCRTYHSLMVSQHCLDGSYSTHSSKCLCWLRFIFYFRNEFFLHYALIIISNALFNAYQASLTIIRRNLLRFCVCIVCVCGRPYGSLIFQKHCELTLKIFC